MIYTPQLADQFVVVIKHPDEDIEKTLSMQIENFVVNYKTNELTLGVVQPMVGGALHEVLMQLFNQSSQLILFKAMSGEEASYIIQYDTTPKNHEFVADYAAGTEPAVHKLTFTINNSFAIDPS
jgi:hypothetical protein